MRSHSLHSALTILSFTFAFAATASSTSQAALSLGARAISPPSNVSLDKRNYCILGVCLGSSTNYESDVNNCGSVGQKCQIEGADATSCHSGVCVATECQSGYTLKSGTCTRIDTEFDVENCGSFGNACKFSPPGASGVCQKGQCIATSCPKGCSLTNGACVKLHGSQRPHWKKDKVIKAKALCPGVYEVACPILGSNSYAQAVAHHFSSPTEFSGIMAGAGGCKPRSLPFRFLPTTTDSSFPHHQTNALTSRKRSTPAAAAPRRAKVKTARRFAAPLASAARRPSASSTRARPGGSPPSLATSASASATSNIARTRLRPYGGSSPVVVPSTTNRLVSDLF